MGLFKKLFGNNGTTPAPIASARKVFDANNPYEIYDMVNALSTVVANVSDSFLNVVMQSENPAKGWPKVMRVSATIDDWRNKNYQVNIGSFLNLGLSHEMAAYLSTIPFSVNGDTLSYEFPVTLDNPEYFKKFVLAEMQAGVANSSYVRCGVHHVTITDRGFLQLKVD